MAIVYHIHEKGNTDINFGYIGITKRSFKERLTEHKCSNSNLYQYFSNPNLEIEFYILFEGSLEEVESKERALRPESNMGWNIARGGGSMGESIPIESYYKASTTRKNNGYYTSSSFLEGQKKRSKSLKDKNKNLSLPVYKINLLTNKVIYKYKSIREAAESTIESVTTKNRTKTLYKYTKKIERCCNKNSNTCAGFGWKYV